MSAASLSGPGALVRARGREWVVLPESTDDLLMLRPVGGLDEEVTGLLPAVEPVAPATFRLPGREDLGDFASGRLLRDAARLSTRTAAGPFRSFGRIAVEPRPYQLVPLMMALDLDPVRLLVADDVGIGKTVEACLIARELLDRGEIRRIAVLCPPHLAEQWQRELAEKFHLEAELVLSSTIQRLERDLPLGVSVFERHPVTVVSTDFIKAARRAEDFALKCPELVIVDEAHGCTLAGGSRSGRGATGRTGSDRRGQRSRHGRQQRHDLLRRLAADPERHLVLVTATPHSGNEEAFRSLLGLLEDDFADLPADHDRAEREGVRSPNPNATCCPPPSNSNSTFCSRLCPRSRPPSHPSRRSARKPSAPRTNGCGRLPEREPHGEQAGAASPSNPCCPWTSWAPGSCCRSSRRRGPEPKRSGSDRQRVTHIPAPGGLGKPPATIQPRVPSHRAPRGA